MWAEPKEEKKAEKKEQKKTARHKLNKAIQEESKTQYESKKVYRKKNIREEATPEVLEASNESARPRRTGAKAVFRRAQSLDSQSTGGESRA